MWKILGKFLYDYLLQLTVIKWPEYLQENKALGSQVRAIFYKDIYSWGTIILISITLISTLLFYLYFNKKFGRYYSIRSWFTWLLVTSVIIGVITYLVGSSFLSSFTVPITLLMVWLSIINMFYAMVLFLMLSIILQLLAIFVRKAFSKDLSPMGSRTPF